MFCMQINESSMSSNERGLFYAPGEVGGRAGRDAAIDYTLCK